MGNDYKPGSIVISNCPKCGQKPTSCLVETKIAHVNYIACYECDLFISTSRGVQDAIDEWNYMVSLIEKKGDN